MGKFMMLVRSDDDRRRCDRYEFRQYEQATCLSIVQMSTDAEPSGYKTVVAVGTAIARGEDLASKGAVQTI